MSANTPLATAVEDRPRVGRVHRTTKESDVEVVLDLDGSGSCEVSTGLPFFDHMLRANSGVTVKLRPWS